MLLYCSPKSSASQVFKEIITPGIDYSKSDDQKRILTPKKHLKMEVTGLL